MIEAEYTALGIDTTYPGVRVSKEQDDLVRTRVREKLMIEAERDPQFREAALNDRAREIFLRYEAERYPKGEYREDAILPIGEDKRVMMQFITRKTLLAWALHESDERNLAYIKNRLDKWDRHPECKTLAELENAIQ
jgi:hypothetical protein